MNSDAILELTVNTALLLALVFLYEVIPLQTTRRSYFREIFTGILVGIIGMTIMLTPWQFSEGVNFDTRSILLSMAGVFFGGVPTAIAALMTSALRFYQGGSGVFMGIGVILTSAGLGLVWRHRIRLEKETPRWYEFYGFGLIVHLAMLAWTLALPREIMFDVLKKIWLPVMLIYPLGTILLGKTILQRDQRIQLEQALRVKEQAMDSSINAIAISDNEGRLSYVNTAFLKMWGYDREDEVLGEHAVTFWKFEEHANVVVEALQSVGNWTGELIGKKRDGLNFNAQLQASLVKNADGQPVGMMASFIDITERKQAESQRQSALDALRSSEARLQVIFEHANDAIHIVNAHDEIIDVNSRMCEMMGYSRGELLKMRVADLQAPECRIDGNVIQTEMEKYGNSLFEGVNLHRDGRHIPVEISISRIESPQGDLYVSILRDITERKQAEDVLRSSEENLRKAQEYAHVGSWTWNIKTNQLNWSDEMYRIFGIDKESFTGNLADVIGRAIHPDDREKVESSNRSVAEDGRPIPVEYRVVRQDGTIRVVWGEAGELILDEAGSPALLSGIVQDITERKQAEEALRASEEKYRVLFDVFPLGVTVADKDGKILESNREAERLLGLSKEVLERRSIDGTVWQIIRADGSVMPPDEYASIRALNENRLIENVEMGILKGKGVVTWLNVTATPLGNSEVVIAYHDTTTRKQMEGALRESEERYRLLFDSMTEGFSLHELIFDESGNPCDYRFLDVNRAFEELTGLKREELIGRGQREVLPEEDPFWFKTYCKVALTGESVHLDHYSPPLEKYYEVYAYCPAPNQFAVVFMDISERKKTEEALKESEERWRRAISDAPIPIMILDEDDQVLQISAGWTNFSGYTLEEIPMLTDWVERAYGENAAFQKKYIEQLFSIEKTVNNGEWEVAAKNGSKRIWAFQTTPLGKMNKGKRVIQRMALDITERKRAEEEVDQLNTSLEQRVNERTQELLDAQEQLVRHEKLAVLGQMAGSVGHELRNPLGVISNAVYFLKIALSDANEKIKEYLSLIEKQTRISNKIITDLLDFTRIKSVELEPVSISPIIYQALERFPTPESVRVKIEIPADLPPAFADPQHILQILDNLVLNAYQVMSAQGGELTISARIQDEAVCIAVRDTGLGISPENMKKLFEPLFTTKPKGIGLGLAVSKKLIEANNGRIEVQSEVGAGSTFTLYFPLYRRAS